METIKIQTSQNITIDYEVSGLGERILARLIDWGILILFYMIVLLIGLNFIRTISADFRSVIIYGVLGVVTAFYDLFSELFFNGQSIGKKVMKIRVISLDGSRPSLGQYLIRWVFRLVDFTISGQLAGLISVAVSEKKQRIGDILAGTTLVSTQPRTDLTHIPYTLVPESYKPVFVEATLLSEQDIALVHEVISNYNKGGNYLLLSSTADRIRHLLVISAPDQTDKMDDLKFLKTIIKDFNHFASETSV